MVPPGQAGLFLGIGKAPWGIRSLLSSITAVAPADQGHCTFHPRVPSLFRGGTLQGPPAQGGGVPAGAVLLGKSRHRARQQLTWGQLQHSEPRSLKSRPSAVPAPSQGSINPDTAAAKLWLLLPSPGLFPLPLTLPAHSRAVSLRRSPLTAADTELGSLQEPPKGQSQGADVSPGPCSSRAWS